MTAKVWDTAVSHDMIEKGDRVTVALSGGADSTALLLALAELSRDKGFTVSAFHVNHCIRGEESDRDEQFCRRVCLDMGVAFESVRLDVPAYAEKMRLSVEEAARKLRYDALYQVKCDKIATAHNMGDNAETVLFNIARGTGLRGLCGIPYRRGRVIRPLLDVTREEIEEYLSSKGQTYVTDSTNLSDDYTRNKIRHQVIPVLKGIAPDLLGAVSRLCETARTDEGYFSELLTGIDPETAVTSHTAVRRRYIADVLRQHDIPVSYERICELEGIMGERKSTRICLTGDVFAVFRKGVMSVERIGGIPAFECEIDVNGCEIVTPYDKTVKISRIYCDTSPFDDKFHRKLTYNALSCDKIQGVPILRCKRDGDKIRFAGREHTTKLKKLYNSLGLSVNDRAAALVIEDEEGIIWSEYGGAAERAKASQGEILVIEI